MNFLVVKREKIMMKNTNSYPLTLTLSPRGERGLFVPT
jgi:hypothetical protein